MKIKNVNFKDANQPMTNKDRAMLMLVSMATATSLENQQHGSALPEDQRGYFGSTGNLYFEKKENRVCNTCPTVYEGTSNIKAYNTFSVSMDDVPLTNDDLNKLVEVRPIIPAKLIDENVSPYENLGNIFSFTVGMVQVQEQQFKEEKAGVNWFQKVVSKVKTGREPFEKDEPITETIQGRAIALGRSFDANVKGFASNLDDLAFNVQCGRDTTELMGDLVIKNEVEMAD